MPGFTRRQRGWLAAGVFLRAAILLGRRSGNLINPTLQPESKRGFTLVAINGDIVNGR